VHIKEIIRAVDEQIAKAEAIVNDPNRPKPAEDDDDDDDDDGMDI